MLVEAALNSVSNMINETMSSDNGGGNMNDMGINENGADLNQEQYGNTPGADEEMKMMKSQNFSSFQFANHSPVNPHIINDRAEMESNDSPPCIKRDKMAEYAESEMMTYESQQPQQQTHKAPSTNESVGPISPNQNEFNYAPTPTRQQMVANSPIRTTPRQVYSEHDLISPASTPSLPRYDFGNDGYNRRQPGPMNNYEARLVPLFKYFCFLVEFLSFILTVWR
jgi:hypothetical protein